MYFCSGLVDEDHSLIHTHTHKRSLPLSLIHSHTHSLRHSRSLTQSVTLTHSLPNSRTHSPTHRSRQIVVLNNGLKKCELKPLHIILRHYEYSGISLKELRKTDEALSQRPGVYTVVSRVRDAVCIVPSTHRLR